MSAFTLRSKRFEFQRQLGCGGMGLVYQAYDREMQTLVAIKVLRSLEGERLFRFKKEFRALADIHHRNLARLGELHQENGSWFFTMELIRGGSFLDHVRPRPVEPSPPGPTPEEPEDSSLVTRTSLVVPNRQADIQEHRLGAALAGLPQGGEDRPAGAAGALAGGGWSFDEARLRDALRQLAAGIHALHRAGHIHRDIKPGNVMVHDGERVVILDFGIIGELRGNAQVKDNLTVGTPAFMAPEQIAGVAVGPQADWYAMGAMLFQALTGRYPFMGSAVEIMRAKRMHAAPRPGELVSGVPPDLDWLCTKLLLHDPAQRPSSEQILQALRVEHDDLHLALPEMQAQTLEMLFVGRDAEVARLLEALEDARAGRGSAVLVHGDPGIGKSALVRQFLERATLQDPSALVPRGRCYEQESVPFRAFDAIVDAVSLCLMALPDMAVVELLGGGVQALARVFPVLSRVPAIQRLLTAVPYGGNDAEKRVQLFDELAALLAALGSKQQLILAIDDLQWADHDSLLLLEHLLGERGVARWSLLVATVRTARTDMEPGCAALLERLESTCRAVRLSGLSGAHGAQLIRQLWAAEGASPGATTTTSERLVEAFLREAGGHPLFLAELARWAHSQRNIDLASIRFEDVLWQRIEQLEPDERRILWLTAVVGVPAPYRSLAHAAELDGDAAQRVLATLRSAQLVSVSRVGHERLIEPYHDRIREAMRERMALELGHSLVATHLAIARSLLAHDPAAQGGNRLYLIVRHMNAGAPGITEHSERMRLVGLNLRAGQMAKQAMAYDTAGEYLAQAITLLGEDAWSDHYDITRSLHIETLEVEYTSGDRERAASRFEQLLAYARTNVEEAELYVIKVRLESCAGRHADAIRVGLAGLRLLGMGISARASSVTILREYVKIRRVQGGRAPFELRAIGQLCDSRLELALQFLVALIPPAFFSDSKLLTVILMRIAYLSLRHGITSLSAPGFAAYGGVLAGAFRNYQEACAMGELAQQLVEEYESKHLINKVFHVCGTFVFPWGRPFSQAMALLREGARAGRAYGDPQYEAFSAGTVMAIAMCQGIEIPRFLGEAAHSIAITRHRRDRDMSGMLESMIRFCQALHGATDGPLSMSNSDSSEPALCASFDAATTPCAWYYYHLHKAQLLYLFGEYRLALAQLALANRYDTAVFGMVVSVDHAVFLGLCAAQLCGSSGWSERRRYRRMVVRALRWLRRCAMSCPENFEHRFWLLSGAHARISDRGEEAVSHVELAARTARTNHSPKFESLALGLMAELCREQGRTEQALSSTDEAIAAYRRWGAEAKAAQLSAKRAQE